MQFKVLAENGVILEGTDETVHPQGAMIEIDPSSEQAIALVGNKAIEPVEDTPPIVTKKYEVLKGPISNREAEVFQTGNVIELEVNDPLTETFLKEGMIGEIGTKKQTRRAQVASIAAPVEPGTAGDTEPRLRYRNQIVISESDRVVGEQTFKHIRCADGVEYDLTEKEYAGEVKMSYPSQE